MKKIKFMAMLLMATMTFGFTSCSDDDEDGAPSPETMEAYLEGEWFLVKQHRWYEYDEGDEEYTETWDFNDPYEEGSEGSSSTILSIENYGNDQYYFELLKGDSGFDDEGLHTISDNVIDSDYSDYPDFYESVAITKLNSDELVIVYEEYDGNMRRETYTYRRMADEE